MQHIRLSVLSAAVCALVLPMPPNSVIAAAQSPSADAKEMRAKQESAEHAAMWRAPKRPGYRTDVQAPPQPTGVVDSGLAPLPGGVYDIRNQWHGVENGQLVSAYAGALRAGGRPVVVILTRSIDYHRVSALEVREVKGIGPVSILGVVAGQLVLRDADGARITMDAPHAKPLLSAPR